MSPVLQYKQKQGGKWTFHNCTDYKNQNNYNFHTKYLQDCSLHVQIHCGLNVSVTSFLNCFPQCKLFRLIPEAEKWYKQTFVMQKVGEHVLNNPHIKVKMYPEEITQVPYTVQTWLCAQLVCMCGGPREHDPFSSPAGKNKKQKQKY